MAQEHGAPMTCSCIAFTQYTIGLLNWRATFWLPTGLSVHFQGANRFDIDIVLQGCQSWPEMIIGLV